MSDTASPGCAGLTPPLPPFSPVQVTSCLPPITVEATQKMLDRFRAEHPKITSFWEGEALKTVPDVKPPIQRRENPTGLSRAEIRLLAEAVSEANDWRGSLVGNPDPGPLDEFDARITKMKAAIKKLKTASGYNFSGRKKK